MKNRPAETSEPPDAVTLPSKLAYGVGGFADVQMKQMINGVANPIFQIHLGVSPTQMGLAIGLVRLWDAFTDLFVGKMSDRCQSRLGRRLPFLAAGALAAALCFLGLMWFPLGATTEYYFWHFFAGTLLFFTAYTFYSVPFSALGYEQTESYNERTRVFAFSSFCGGVASLLLNWSFWFTQRPVFGGTVEGARALGVVAGGVMIIAACVPVFFLREHPGGRAAARRAQPLSWKETKSALRLAPYRIVLGLVFVMLLVNWTVNGLGLYINVYFVYGGEMAPASTLQGWIGTSQQVVALVSVPVITRLAARYGKPRALRWCLLSMLAGSISKYYTFHPDHPYLELVTTALLAPGITAVYLLCQSFLADICDLDELENGERREGFLGSIYLWATKLAISVGFILTGVVLVGTGFHRDFGANQPPQAIFYMRVLFAFLPAVATTVAIFMLGRLKLERHDVEDIQQRLHARRSTRAAETAP